MGLGIAHPPPAASANEIACRYAGPCEGRRHGWISGSCLVRKRRPGLKGSDGLAGRPGGSREGDCQYHKAYRAKHLRLHTIRIRVEARSAVRRSPIHTREVMRGRIGDPLNRCLRSSLRIDADRLIVANIRLRTRRIEIWADRCHALRGIPSTTSVTGCMSMPKVSRNFEVMM
jgi:hypothetical protein